MIKLIFGEETYSINKYLKKITDSPMTFDETDSHENVVMELTNKSLFNNNKEIIIRNFITKKVMSVEEELIEALKKMDDNDTVIFVYDSNLLPKNNLISFLRKNHSVEKFEKIKSSKIKDEIFSIVNINGGTIDSTTAYRLQNLLPNNLSIIESEIKKLIMYNKNITSDTINNLSSIYIEDDYFALSNAIVAGDVVQILRSIKDKTETKVSALSIVAQVSQTLTLALRVYSLKQFGTTNQKMAEEIGVHIFRIKKSLELINNFSIKKIKKIILLLAKFDFEIKTGILAEENLINFLTIELIR